MIYEFDQEEILFIRTVNEKETSRIHYQNYLKKAFRGKGYSKTLDDFAINFFKSLGINKAKLSVSPINIRAIKFYEKNGWEDKGPRSFKDHTLPHVLHFMEKAF